MLAKDGRKIDNDLMLVLMGLPLAMRLVRKDIEATEGLSCCADKARLLLKTFVYERLGLDVPVTPWTPPSEVTERREAPPGAQ